MAATEEVEREALAAVTAGWKRNSEFRSAVWNWAASTSPSIAVRRQYGSIPMLEMLLRRCPGDAVKLLAVTERDLFIPVLTFVFGQAQLGGRCGRGFPGAAAAGVLRPARPIARFFWSGLTKKRSTKPAICSGWCTVRNERARCRWPPHPADRFEG